MSEGLRKVLETAHTALANAGIDHALIGGLAAEDLIALKIQAYVNEPRRALQDQVDIARLIEKHPGLNWEQIKVYAEPCGAGMRLEAYLRFLDDYWSLFDWHAAIKQPRRQVIYRRVLL